VKGKGTRVFGGSVALMILQTVRGVKRGEFRHGSVARNLGQDRGSGDGGAAGVALDNGDFRAGEARLFVAVDEAEMGLKRQTRDGAAHGEEAGLEDIVGVDFLDGGEAEGPAHVGMAAEKMAEFLPLLDRELLRVVEVRVPQAVGQHGRRRVDRPGPAAAPDFIDTRHQRGVGGTQAALEFPSEGIVARHG